LVVDAVMEKLAIFVFIVSVLLPQSQGQESSSPWRKDGRCGAKYPLPSGNPGQCDPTGNGPKKGPCCSPKGFCGNTEKHCACATCVDYSEASEKKLEAVIVEKKEKETKPAKKTAGLKLSSESEKTQEQKVVQTRVGAIRGKHVINDDGLSHYNFLSIPYAQPPIGNLRFKPPIPVRPWTNTLEAFEFGPQCIQQVDPDKEKPMSEDCLHLSIYMKDMKKTTKPVMIWIHGGSFTQGSGNDYTPRNIVQEDVIVVVINYRLGSLGFLTFGNNLVSGNMGLKDQALAIQWVKQNIESFGGNPNKITIFGESAGGMSVHAHVLSPWNYGQIQGAIAQSGTMLFYNSIQSYGEREEVFAKTAAKLVGCSDENLDISALECLQNIDIKEITEKLTYNLADEFARNMTNVFDWRPVIDNYASNPFLPHDPLEAIKTGIFNRIPFMSGTVKNEGALWMRSFSGAGETRNQILENWDTFGPRQISSSNSVNITVEDIMRANISLKYYNHPECDAALEKDQPFMDLFSDVSFISPDQKTVQIMSKHSPNVFNYYLTQQTENSLIGLVLQLEPEYTPIHADDLVFLFDPYGLKLNLSEEETALSKQMLKYWTNFAKYGHPTPSSQDTLFWKAVSQSEMNYMELKAEPEMGRDLLQERMLFWERMLWAEKEETIDRKIMYTQATQFLLDNTR